MSRLFYTVALLLSLVLIVSSHAATRTQTDMAERTSALNSGRAVIRQVMQAVTLGWYRGASDDRDEHRALRESVGVYTAVARGSAWTLAVLAGAFLALQTRRARVRGAARPLLWHLLATSAVFLLVGLSAPMLTLAVYEEVPVLGQVVLSYEVKSILTMVWALADAGSLTIALLLFVFSVLTPVAKLVLSLMALGLSDERRRARAAGVVHAIGRWSMTDVFVVAILLAYLSANSMQSTAAQPGPGLYYFAAYAVLSIIAGRLLLRPSDSL